MKQLTRRQQQVLDVIRQHIEEAGFPPSVREIGELIGLRSSCTVQRHLEALVNKGFVRRDGSKARTLEIVGAPRGKPAALAYVPLVGRVAAGQPALAAEDIEDTIPIGVELVGRERTFALRVRGDSMIGAGLFDGDIVVVRQQDHAENGDVVVALVDGEEATVKRLFRDGGRVCLRPENPSMEPIYPRQVAILGKVVLSLRRFP